MIVLFDFIQENWGIILYGVLMFDIGTLYGYLKGRQARRQSSQSGKIVE